MQEKQAEFRRFQQDAEYYEAHWEILLREHPEQWVAIFNEELIGADADYDALLHQVQAKGFDVGRVFIERATAKDDLLILVL